MALLYAIKAKEDRERRQIKFEEQEKWEEDHEFVKKARNEYYRGKMFSQARGNRPSDYKKDDHVNDFTTHSCHVKFVEADGYVKTKNLVEGMLNAGAKLQLAKKDLYDFETEESVDENYNDPTRSPGYDEIDMAEDADRFKKASELANMALKSKLSAEKVNDGGQNGDKKPSGSSEEHTKDEKTQNTSGKNEKINE